MGAPTGRRGGLRLRRTASDGRPRRFHLFVAALLVPALLAAGRLLSAATHASGGNNGGGAATAVAMGSLSSALLSADGSVSSAGATGAVAEQSSSWQPRVDADGGNAANLTYFCGGSKSDELTRVCVLRIVLIVSARGGRGGVGGGV